MKLRDTDVGQFSSNKQFVNKQLQPKGLNKIRDSSIYFNKLNTTYDNQRSTKI